MTAVDLTPPAPVAPRVLSIAGTDPTGGAGIQADLKSIAANGGYGMAVVTALVAQNTMGVRSIHTPPVEFLAEQLDAVSDDVIIDAVKIGMLFDSEIITTVSRWLHKTQPPLVVFDPVMIAASGDRLLTQEAESAVRELLPMSDLITPNIPELATLVGQPEARTWDEAIDQARTLATSHDVLVLMKGGHLEGPESSDALVDATGVIDVFTSARINTKNTHGTGCSLSSAIATMRAQTGDWSSAIRAAKAWLTESIIGSDALCVGHGSGPVSHFAGLWRRGGTTTVSATDVASEWWQQIEQIRTDIDELDFITALVEGTLDHAAFVWYLEQDALYLRDYSRALAAASALAPTPAEQAFWASNAHGAIASEVDLHARWLPAETLFTATASSTTIAYVDHFMAIAARGNYQELIAALLPCFWIYVDVGSRLAPNVLPENPYAPWLQTYGDPEFDGLNREAIDIVTTHAAAATADTRDKMWAAFEKSARHELYFFAAPLQRTLSLRSAEFMFPE